MPALWTLLAVLATIAVIWLAAEERRENCMASGYEGCTVLPWSGDPPAAAPEP